MFVDGVDVLSNGTFFVRVCTRTMKPRLSAKLRCIGCLAVQSTDECKIETGCTRLQPVVYLKRASPAPYS